MTKGVTWHQAQEKSLKHTSTAQDWMIHFHYLDFHIDVLIKKLQRNELLPFCTQTVGSFSYYIVIIRFLL